MRASLIALALLSAPAFAQDADLIERGRYLATAADCAACHRTAEVDGKPFAGGYTIASPMGPIVASNITPSKEFGIGNWTEEQFARAIREGVAPEGHLYPAMPYTAYAGISDEDVHAIYTYLMQDVAPVDEAPSARTDLAFPFNQRILMAGWNLLFNRAEPFSAEATEAERGKYLVDVLEHCSACHSPRNVLMGEDNGNYLAGGDVGGWHAPNITSDPVSGIGGWSRDELVTYLRTGAAAGKSQAAGGMAEAVEHSLRKLTDDDLGAIADYLKQVPPVRDPGQTAPAYARAVPTSVSMADLDAVANRDPKVMTDGTSLDGQELYMGACATCHQPHGQGTEDQFYPSLTANRATGGPVANNLVLAIANGIHRKTNDYTVSMPAFGEELTDGQIASVSNYVLATFGNAELSVSEADVATLRAGGKPPLLVRATPWLMGLGALVAVVIIIALALLLRRRKSA